jgi:hypothetical protein
MTQRTKLPLSLNAADRQVIEAVAKMRGLKLSTWVRVAALESSRRELDERRLQPSGRTEGS